MPSDRTGLTSIVVLVTLWAGLSAAQEQSAPTGHLAVPNPAALAATRAEGVYQAIRREMRRQYARSSDPVTLAYQEWRRFTTVPYRSSLHGERFVNNYANDLAGRYGRYEKSGPMPPGAMVAKDSFTVTDTGNVATGPLFLMEKKKRGFDRNTGDWLFMMFLPDGTLVGDAPGRNSDSVAFCVKCHNTAPPEQDHLFFMPKNVRVQTGN